MIDALTVRALGAEFQATIAGGRVQQVYFLTPQSIGLEIYARHERHYLLCSAEPQRARLLLASQKLRTASVPLTPFLLLSKKYADGAFLNRVEVVPHERILRFEFDHSAHGLSTLVVELMGNRSNLILLNAGGVILDALRRVPAAMNRVREIVPRAKYLPPPPQLKADPLAATAAELGAALENAKGETLAARLVAGVAGTSPLCARELAYRVSGSTASLYAPGYVSDLHQELTRVWRAPAEPCLGWENEQPIAVAAISLTHLAHVEKTPSMSAALEKFFGAAESYDAVKAPLRAEIAAGLDKLERLRANLQRELVSADEIENLKLKGEMILGYQYALEPGQTGLRAQVTDDLTLDVALDPKLTPVENANKYFAEYKRARDAAARVPERLAVVENDIAYARQLLDDLDNAETRAEIDQVAQDARDANLVRETKMQRGTRERGSVSPRQYLSPDGFPVLVGRNARQNDWLTFDRAKADDLWLHARDAAGSHVIILSNGAEVPQATLEFAASLAAYYSQVRRASAVDVIYTARRSVHRVRGAGAHPGLVTVREERVIRVKPYHASESL